MPIAFIYQCAVVVDIVQVFTAQIAVVLLMAPTSFCGAPGDILLLAGRAEAEGYKSISNTSLPGIVVIPLNADRGE
jgi:hypothetical protein